MKKTLLSIIAALSALSAFAGAGIVNPIEVYWDVNHLKDGEYAVSFDIADVQSTANGAYITFEIFSENLYDGKLLAQLEKGDQIIARDEVFTVKTVQKEDDWYFINRDEGGVDFESVGGGKYRVCIEDDHSTYTSQGKVKLFVPLTAKMIDDGIDGIPMKSKTIKGSKIASYIKSSWSPEFFYLNTRITVKKGRVAKIVRFYIP